MKREILTLTNGKKVANFSSPHPFTFEDGSILPAVGDNKAKYLQVTFEETDLGEGDIKLNFRLTDSIFKEMRYWQDLHEAKEVDVVFCPLPMITALYFSRYDVINSPFRTIRVTDRIKKLVSIEKQCL